MLTHVLLEMLVDAPPGDARRRVWCVVVAPALMLLGVAGMAAALWLMVQTAFYGWQQVDWRRLEGAQFLSLNASYLLIFPALYLYAVRPVPRQIQRALVETLEAGDTTLAPMAAAQPAPLAADDLAPLVGEPLYLARLRAFQGGYTSTSGTSPLGLWVAIMFLSANMVFRPLIQALGISEAGYLFGIPMSDLDFPLLIISIVMVVVAIYLLIGTPSGTLTSRWLYTTADERGLVWRRGPWVPERHADWSEIHALWHASYTPQRNQAPTVSYDTYLVDTKAGVLGWILFGRPKESEYAASDLLIRLIVTRADVPLRDLAPLMDSVAQTRGKLRQLRAVGLPDAIKSPLITIRKRSWRGLWLLVPAIVLFVVLYGGPLIAENRLEAAQHDYFAGLAPRILAQRPLYHDELATDEGQWPLSQPSAANGQQRHAFVNGAYTLSGQPDQFVLALSPLQYGDAAIAVTARQQGSAGLDGVGMVLRASRDERNLLVFYVSSDGTWTIGQYLNTSNPTNSDLAYVKSGENSAIHRGDGATNQLLVVARGQAYLFYINGVLVYPADVDLYDSPQDALSQGYVGVYLNDGANSGSFTDFSVYPVQSPPSLSYV